MNCITLKNPKASHVIMGRVNEIPMRFSTKHKGPLLIHASLGLNDRLKYYGDPHEQVTGVILGFVDLLGMGRKRHGIVQWRVWHPMAFASPIPYRSYSGGGTIKIYDVQFDGLEAAIGKAVHPSTLIEPMQNLQYEDVYPSTLARRRGRFAGD